jgi:hypothetical protein
MDGPILIAIIIAISAASFGVGYFTSQKQVDRYVKSITENNKHEMNEMSNRLLKSENDLRNAKSELDEYCNNVSQLKQELGIVAQPPNGLKLAGYLSELYDKICINIDKIELMRVKLIDNIVIADDESKYRRTCDGIDRFRQYHEELIHIDRNLASYCEKLVAALSSIIIIRDMLVDGGMASFDDIALVSSANKVLRNIADEYDIDEVWADANRRRNAEFKKISKMRELLNQIDRNDREQTRIMTAVIFERYSLPPLTPKEKFDRLKSFGSRDSFDL